MYDLYLGSRGVRLQGQLRVHGHRGRRHRADGPRPEGAVGALLQVGQGRPRVAGVDQREGPRNQVCTDTR